MRSSHLVSCGFSLCVALGGASGQAPCVTRAYGQPFGAIDTLLGQLSACIGRPASIDAIPPAISAALAAGLDSTKAAAIGLVFAQHWFQRAQESKLAHDY